MGRLFLTLIGSIAELESDLIRERVLAGMRRAKLDGVRIGRAPMNIDRAAIVRDRLSGMTLTAVAKKWGISRSLVCKLVKRSQAGDEGSMLPPPSVVDSVHVMQSSSAGHAGEKSIESSPRKDKMISDKRARRAAMSRRLKQVQAAKRKAKEAHSKGVKKASA